MDNMLEKVSPPTDNLYKFLAISGLLLLILSVIYPYWISYRVMQQANEFFRDLRLLELENKQLSKLSEEIKSKGEELKASKNITSEQVDEFAQRAEDVIDKRYDVVRMDTEIDYKEKQLNTAVDTMLPIWTARVGVFIGLIFMSGGFILWYFKLQRYQEK
jgi:biopolymer transport protein ExbB/TolQ